MSGSDLHNDRNEPRLRRGTTCLTVEADEHSLEVWRVVDLRDTMQTEIRYHGRLFARPFIDGR